MGSPLKGSLIAVAEGAGDAEEDEEIGLVLENTKTPPPVSDSSFEEDEDSGDEERNIAAELLDETPDIENVADTIAECEQTLLYETNESQGAPGKDLSGLPVNDCGDERVKPDSSPRFKARVAASQAVLRLMRTEIR